MKNKNKIRIYPFIAVGFAFIFANSCSEKDNSMSSFYVRTATVTEITSTSAICGGTVQNNAGAILKRGVYWSTHSDLQFSNSNIIECGSGDGTFACQITGLSPSTTYHINAFAMTAKDTAYGYLNIFSTLATTSFYIGQNYGGGIIFSIDGTGQHGLIAAPTDQSTGAEWGCFGTAIATTVSGQANTNAIVNGCGEGGIAARICDGYTLSIYSDWFLPSKNEIEKLWLHQDVVPNLSHACYWSSSAADESYAWDYSWGLAGMMVTYKNQPYYVRCIRAF